MVWGASAAASARVWADSGLGLGADSVVRGSVDRGGLTSILCSASKVGGTAFRGKAQGPLAAEVESLGTSEESPKIPKSPD